MIKSILSNVSSVHIIWHCLLKRSLLYGGGHDPAYFQVAHSPNPEHPETNQRRHF